MARETISSFNADDARRPKDSSLTYGGNLTIIGGERVLRLRDSEDSYIRFHATIPHDVADMTVTGTGGKNLAIGIWISASAQDESNAVRLTAGIRYIDTGENYATGTATYSTGDPTATGLTIRAVGERQFLVYYPDSGGANVSQLDTGAQYDIQIARIGTAGDDTSTAHIYVESIEVSKGI